MGLFHHNPHYEDGEWIEDVPPWFAFLVVYGVLMGSVAMVFAMIAVIMRVL